MKYKGNLTGQKGYIPNTALWRSHLEYFIQLWRTHFLNDNNKPEEDHRRPIKMLSKQRGTDLQREIKRAKDGLTD